MGDRLLDPGDRDLIRQLKLQVKRRVSGLATGEQRSPSLGGGIEFADYREYLQGDDIRQVDWTVFLRLRKLLVKRSAEEKELCLMVILDNSQSMRFGEPDKFRMAKRLCAVLCGIAMASGNRAGVLTWGDTLEESVTPQRTSRSFAWLANRVDAVPVTRKVDYAGCMRQFASRYGRRCVAVLVSDLLFPAWPQVVASLAASGCESHVLHVLSPQELDPLPQGEVTFVDAETDLETPLHLDAKTIASYHVVLDGYLESVRSTCLSKGIGHARVPSDKALASVFHDDLRKAGLVC